MQTHINRSLYMVLCFLSVSVFVSAQQEGGGRLRLTQQELINLKPSRSGSAPGSSNLRAVQEIVVTGDPSKAGLYTIMLKVAPHTRIPAHKHPDERMGTVISGTWYFGYGDKFNESKVKKLPAGSIYSEVKNQNHFAMTGDEAVIVEINGYGPSGVTFVDPADDPLHKK